MMRRVLRRLSRLAPRWRRNEWLREWTAEIDAAGARQPVSLAMGAAVHVVWLWRHEWSIDMMGSDIRYAVRTLVGRPAFALTVLVTLTLGIGATTAMFTIVDAVMLRALPYPRPDRLVAVWPGMSVSPHVIDQMSQRREGLDAVGAYSGWGFTLTGGTQAEAVSGARVTPQLLALLGVRPILGDWFSDDAVRPGNDRVVLIGEGLWRRRFGGDPAAVGRRLAIGGVDFTIAGVMPASFEFPARRSEIWAPVIIDSSRDDFDANFLRVIGRLSENLTPAGAQERMRAYARELHDQFPKQFGGRFVDQAEVAPLHLELVRDIRKPLLLLLVAVGVLLLIACANTAHLLLARSRSRETEIAVRASLGAGRLRLVRQLLVESLILAGVGGVAGLLLASWLVGIFVPLVPDLPQISRAVVIDARVAAFVALLIVGCAVVFGLMPALQLSKSNVSAALASGRGGGRSPHRSSAGRTLVWAEVALATLLVVSAALLTRSFVHLTRVDLGFDPKPVLTLRASAPAFRYREDAQIRTLFADILDRVRAVAGVQAAGAIHLLPLTGDNWNPGVKIDAWPEAEQYQQDVNWRAVTPDYFRAMHIPSREGRAFDETDDDRMMPVAIVNEAFVRTVFRGRPALGQRVRTAFEGKNSWATVVGVVGDVRQHSVDQAPLPEMYRPFAQHPVTGMRLMVRVAGDPDAIAPAVRAAVASVDADIAIDDLQPMSSVVDHALGGARLPLVLATMFSLVAMALGVTGVAGILSFDVAERRGEIGLRLALGAPPASIRRLFLRRGLRLGAAGVVAGAIAAVGLAGLLRSLLFGIDPADPATIGMVSAVFLAVIAGASYIPAHRAARVDPLTTLRAQ
jgi:putative ABC transport system permease protein